MYENFVLDIEKSDFPDFFKDEIKQLLTKDNILEIKDIVILQMEKEMSDNIRTSFHHNHLIFLHA